ncbi:MAG: uracil-DNA glycosylase [Acidobacteriia bacterium]|nr:uracil-DNA glycosylase [Terriglobia bacterium]
MSRRTPAGDDLRRTVGDWLAYLRDIGVRELSATSDLPGRSAAPARAPTPATASTEAPAVPSGGELFTLTGPAADEPRDPVQRLREIREEIGDCTRCKLHAGRNHIVFGVGNPNARLMFVGEGPGADEDARGEPFVGRAGRKLDEMIRAIGLDREDVYIANVVKCRPPENRAPEPDEIGTCVPFLFAQIEAIRPRVLVALGAPAAKTLLGTRVGITQIRGTWGTFRGIPVMPTFHPAYLLRAYTPENRRKVWEDLKAARAKMDSPP